MNAPPILILDEDNFDEQIQHPDVPILVDFWASWCQPCKSIAPEIEKVAVELAGRVRFAKVDVDHNGDLANRFGIRSIPTLVVFKCGKVVDQMVGLSARNQIRGLLERHLD